MTPSEKAETPSPATPERPPVPSDDALDELPPLDGGEEGEPEADYADLVDGDAEAGDPFDDATGEDDPVDATDLDALATEAAWVDNADEADDLDLGGSELATLGGFDGETAGAADFEEPGVGDEDYGLGTVEERGGLDGGEEGPSDADEEMKDADLPPLDADEEGDVEDADLLDPSFAANVETKLEWANRPWEPVGAPVSLGPVTAVVCVARGVLAASQGLFRVDLEGACERVEAAGLVGDVQQLEAAGAIVAARTTHGSVLVSSNGGGVFAKVARFGAPTAAGDATNDVKEIALSAGELCVLTRKGELYASHDAGGTFRGPIGGGRIAAIAEDGGRGVVAVTSDGDGNPLAVVRDSLHGEGVAMMLPDAAVGALSGRLRVAARGSCLACAGAERGLVRTIDGERWSVVEGIAGTVGLTILDDAGTLLVATYREAEDTTWLVRVSREGVAEIVAELDAAPPSSSASERGAGDAASDDEPDAGGMLRAMARDDAHGVVWVAGAFGLLAFEQPPAD